MAWLGKVSLGNFSDIAGAVTKLSESVKNIEKNFDSALGFDEKGVHDDAQSSTSEKRTLLEPVFAFVGQRDFAKEHDPPATRDPEPSLSKAEKWSPHDLVLDQKIQASVVVDDMKSASAVDQHASATIDAISSELDTKIASSEGETEQVQASERESSSSVHNLEECAEPIRREDGKRIDDGEGDMNAEREDNAQLEEKDVTVCAVDMGEARLKASSISVVSEALADNEAVERSTETDFKPEGLGLGFSDRDVPALKSDGHATKDAVIMEHKQQDIPNGTAFVQSDLSSLSEISEQNFQSTENDSGDINKLKAEVKMLETALQAAASQAKIKADEISRLLMENDHLRSVVGDSKKSNDAELDALREEYQQRLNAAERKVYTLTKERDMLRREQTRKDSAILLKEKDEIIKQVMAEGEELSKKQAAQESQMRKLRAQIRELEEEKQRLKSKLQVEEATVESIRKDKAATEKALQEAVERTQVELAIQKEFYTNALNEAKEAEARAEVRADNEAKIGLERRLREAAEREAALVQALEELRQALSRAEQQAAFREDMLRRDVEELEKRCQATERRYEELVASVPESTRPLLRQIEAIRESTAMRVEAWSGVERALNARLQEAEAKAAASQERERAINERLTQTLSRMAVLEAQVSCLKAELAQLNRSLEKERQRASENRQEYLAALESAATHEGRAKQLEEDLKELRMRSKRELAEEKTMRELLEQDLEHEKKKRIEHETQLGSGKWVIADKSSSSHANAQTEFVPGRSWRRFSSGSSGGNLEESFFLQTSLDPTSDQLTGDKRNTSSPISSPFSLKGAFPNATLEQLETLLSQKEGELALYTSRLASLESTRDALAEELVKATTQCEKLRSEVASLPGLCSELESLRRRHTSALELMGERDEEVEELKADLADVKQMYREQIDMLINQIEQLSISIGNR